MTTDNTDNTDNPNDPLLAHEALDRTHIVACMVDDYLLFHPFVDRNKDVEALITRASDALAQAYQLIGSKTL